MLRHMKFADLGEQTIAILVPTKDFNKQAIITNYIQPLEARGINREEILVLNLGHTNSGKYLIKDIVAPWVDLLGKAIKNLGLQYLMICEPTYFKRICQVSKSEPHHGYVLPTMWDDVEGLICPNYTSLFYNPANREKIDMACTALSRRVQGKRPLFSADPTTKCYFPETTSDVHRALKNLVHRRELYCDIEAFSLRVDKAGIASIAFAWSEEEGVAFHVNNNQAIRQYLRHFFINYKGKLIFHGSTYDVKVIIWELFMDHPRDYTGMLRGLHCMFRNLEDTKILAYLSLNSTAGPGLSLKDLAHEFVGNYGLGEDIKDIAKVEPKTLLKYNVTDTLATCWVAHKYWPVVRNEQLEIYETLFKPALKVITQMELCGMPIHYGRVLSLENKLAKITRQHSKAMRNNPVIISWEDRYRDQLAEKANEKLKRLRKTRNDFLHKEFNPGSNPQISDLMFSYLGLPVIDKTEKGNPATGGKTLEALKARLDNGSVKPKHHSTADVKQLLSEILGWGEADKILTTFIPAFKNNSIEKDGWHYLHGGFNLGGPKSGRLSSSEPNLQNIPSTGTDYAPDVKECFMAPPHRGNEDPFGWLFCGADFESLEDRISALQTKDPNKLKIYTDGYDGHCLRAYSYFKDRMPDIDPNSVASINSIKKKYPELRQASKSPTFLLTYMGTWKGLVKTFGFSKDEAKKIADNYHNMYQVSDQWVQDRIKEAQSKGYIELAFGLRLRTPILPQVILESRALPFQAHKEVKTAGNALGQSYGLLNTRAANEFMERVWNSEYAEDILPVCQIHDSLYFMIRNTLGCLKFVNDNLIDCMKWNDLPEIQHPQVKLEAALDVFIPDWSQKVTLENNLSIDKIRSTIRNHLGPTPSG